MRTSKRLAAATGAFVLAVLCWCAVALGSDGIDRSFGVNGVAQAPTSGEEAKGGAPVIFGLANAPGGKMVAALGDFRGFASFAAARFEADGSLDPTFGQGGRTAPIEIRQRGADLPEAQAQAVAAQRDGGIVVAGYLEERQRAYAPLLVRYRADGTLDPGFGRRGIAAGALGVEGSDALHPAREGGGVLHDLALERSGRIIAVGSRNEVGGGDPAALVIAYRPDGQIDAGFGHGGRVVIRSKRDFEFTALEEVDVQRDGGILLVGYLHGRLLLARLTRTGKFDRRFGGGDGRVLLGSGRQTSCCPAKAALAVQPDGRIVVAAESLSRGNALTLARFSPDGRLDRGFGHRGVVTRGENAGFVYPSAVALQPDGRILVVGQGPKQQGEPASVESALAVIRFMPDGRLDRGFGIDGLQSLAVGSQNVGLAALARPDGGVVAAGGWLTGAGSSSESALLLTRLR